MNVTNMDSLSELKYYCEQKNPAGAILLSGEWGSGKTYFIDHDLQNSLKDKCVIIRISLFGISSVDELQKNVKQSWIHARGGLLDKAAGLGRFKSLLEKLADIIPDETAKIAVGSALSFNLFDFLKIENEIDGKTVVIVFDDLERSNLPIQEKLGIINDYCENQHFNVIIIADEEKLQGSEYKNFKEKIIQKTIHYRPAYESIVHSLINAVEDEKYRTLLLENEEYIAALFAGQDLKGQSLDTYTSYTNRSYSNLYESDGIDVKERAKKLRNSRPHNIRSLKYAISEFKRVFQILDKTQVDNTNKWLFSFISFALASKANLIHLSDKFGFLLSDNDVEIIYPGFYDARFMPDVLKKWIIVGIWNEEQLQDYIEHNYLAGNNPSPEELVKKHRIDYLEEEVAIQGLKDLLPDAYEGKLSINDYVVLIINSRLTRCYDLADIHINWDSIQSGIKRRLELNIQNGETHEFFNETISDLEGFSEEEIKAYDLIKNARDNSYTLFEANRRDYIRVMKNEPYEAFIKISSMRFNCFDIEMADATLEAFRAVDNPTKALFPSYFKGVWNGFRNSFDINQHGIETTEKSLRLLKEKLLLLENDYNHQPFKKRYTEAFVTVIDKMLDNDQEPSE